MIPFLSDIPTWLEKWERLYAWARADRRCTRRCGVAARSSSTQASRANQACSVQQIGQRVRAKNTVQR